MNLFRSSLNKIKSQKNIHYWNQFKRWQDLEKDQLEEKGLEERKKNYLKLADGMYISPEKETDVMPKKDVIDMSRRESGALPIELMTNHTMMRYLDHSVDNIKRFKRYQRFQGLQYDQRFIPERTLFLGPNLASAYFIVHRGGSVKFVGDDGWVKKNAKGKYSLPPRNMPGLYLEAIDASSTELMFEGFDNLYDLTKLRLLSLANCHYVDDWTLSRVGTMFSESLEMLDLSDCKKISAKGLLGLRKAKKLKYLRLNGLNNQKEIAKVALLLEEAIPGLEVIGVDYDEAMFKLEAENHLLNHDRALIDAKGNIHGEDDDGRLFYLQGCVNEVPTVDDNDLPIITNTIRREIPKMSDEEFEELDLLSGGKLRHLLVGSPSGYGWHETVETILSFEHQFKLNKGQIVDNKMLPRSKRTDLIEQIAKKYIPTSPKKEIESS
uniref:ATP synthase subunit s, mitochondrial n=1 Tax=Rhabditophanes sp. KR3021 TaxID=114890 RepID=A0AC35TI37_9BILA